MKQTIKITVDRSSAIAAFLLTTFGSYVSLEAWGYGLGSLRRMDTGYYPFILGMGCIIVGVLIFLFEAIKPVAVKQRVSSVNEDDHHPSQLRPLVFVTVALTAFALLIETLGLFAAVITLVLISCFALKKPKVKQAILLTVLTPIGVWLVFVVGLSMPFKLW